MSYIILNYMLENDGEWNIEAIFKINSSKEFIAVINDQEYFLDYNGVKFDAGPIYINKKGEVSLI